MKKIITMILSFALCVSTFTVITHAEECQHDWSEWTVAAEPTCAESGIQEKYCTMCGIKETNVIPPTGQHEWDDWEVTKSATIYKKGKKERVCYICETVQSVSTDKLKPFLKFKKKTYKTKVGKTINLKKKIKYAKGDKCKKWKSSNRRVAIVNSKGKVKARRAGKTTITLKMKSGKRAKCKIVVKAVKKARNNGSSRNGGGGTVYWTDSGSVYHSTSACPTLSRSHNINSGSLSDCPSGRRPCKVCY